jgi:hypothetical protein
MTNGGYQRENPPTWCATVCKKVMIPRILQHRGVRSTWINSPSGKPLPFPWRQSRWQRILVLAAAGCVIVAVLATYFGHAIAHARPLGPNEAIGTVLFVESSNHYVEASYALKGNPDVQGMASGYISGVSSGQPVVVRYAPNQPAERDRACTADAEKQSERTLWRVHRSPGGCGLRNNLAGLALPKMAFLSSA